MVLYTIEPDKKISTKCDIQIRLHKYSVVKIYLDAEKERLVLMNSC